VRSSYSVQELLTALLPGPDCAGGSCAKADVATIKVAEKIAEKIRAERFIEFPPEGLLAIVTARLDLGSLPLQTGLIGSTFRTSLTDEGDCS
jgi:hypothetical protein